MRKRCIKKTVPTCRDGLNHYRINLEPIATIIIFVITSVILVITAIFIIPLETAMISYFTDLDVAPEINFDQHIIPVDLEDGSIYQSFALDIKATSQFEHFNCVTFFEIAIEADGQVVSEIAFAVNNYFVVLAAVNGHHRSAVCGKYRCG